MALPPATMRSSFTTAEIIKDSNYHEVCHSLPMLALTFSCQAVSCEMTMPNSLMSLQELGFRNIAMHLAVEVSSHDSMMYVTIAAASTCADGLAAGRFKPPLSGDLGCLKVHHESDDRYVVPMTDWGHVPAMKIVTSLPYPAIEIVLSDLRLCDMRPRKRSRRHV